MKTAILVTGQDRPQVKNANILVKKMESVFKAQMFFHTWDKNVTKTPIEYHNRLEYCKEPVVDYHPRSDIEWVGKHGKWDNYRKKRLLYNKTQHANKQILAYADLLSKIPNDFDLLIRTRWDVLISQKVKFTPYLEKAYEEGPVGFMTRGNRGHLVDNLLDVPKADITVDWYGYLPDILIHHNRSNLYI